jgi:hypothetical protein
VDLWSSRDALVLARVLPVSARCTHLKGHGGAKAAVRRVLTKLPGNAVVLRTDVKSYYASIDPFLLLDQLAIYLKDRRVLNLIGQYLRRTAERGGVSARSRRPRRLRRSPPSRVCREAPRPRSARLEPVALDHLHLNDAGVQGE